MEAVLVVIGFIVGLITGAVLIASFAVFTVAHAMEAADELTNSPHRVEHGTGTSERPFVTARAFETVHDALAGSTSPQDASRAPAGGGVGVGPHPPQGASIPAFLRRRRCRFCSQVTEFGRKLLTRHSNH